MPQNEGRDKVQPLRAYMNRFILMIIIILILMPFLVFSEESRQQTDYANKKDEIFARIKQAASEVQTLSGEFSQEKHLEILEKVSVSRGKFFYKTPDSLRWEINEPVATGFIVTGDKGKKWRGKAGARQSFELKKEPVIKIITDQIFAWARADFNWLETGYNITVLEENPVTLKLVPLSVAEKKYIDHIKLIFSSTENYVSTIEIHEAGGDYTQIKFFDMTINQPLQEDLF
jgi:outer membrane lipoprotein-sorting protein